MFPEPISCNRSDRLVSVPVSRTAVPSGTSSSSTAQVRLRNKRLRFSFSGVGTDQGRRLPVLAVLAPSDLCPWSS